MHDNHDDPLNGQAEQQAIADPWTAPSTRKGFLKGAAVAGAGAAGLGAFGPAAAFAHGKKGHGKPKKGGLTKTDLEILTAAQIAEALAVTTYTNIINTAPPKRLASTSRNRTSSCRSRPPSRAPSANSTR